MVIRVSFFGMKALSIFISLTLGLSVQASGLCIDLTGTYTFHEAGFEPLTLKYEVHDVDGAPELVITNTVTDSQDKVFIDGKMRDLGGNASYQALCGPESLVIKEFEMDVLVQESHTSLNQDNNIRIIFKEEGQPDLEAIGIRN